jgi:hypothetical protein
MAARVCAETTVDAGEIFERDLSPCLSLSNHGTLSFKMKSFQLILVALVVACASAFAPVHTKSVAFQPLAAVTKLPQEQPNVVVSSSLSSVEHKNNAAAIAAFATALAPLAAHATEVDEATIIGYGAGLVACVVSLAVGFAIGYGTLVKL